MAYITKNELGNLLKKAPNEEAKALVVTELLKTNEIEGFMESLPKERLAQKQQEYNEENYKGFFGGIKKLGAAAGRFIGETAESITEIPQTLTDNIRASIKADQQRQEGIGLLSSPEWSKTIDRLVSKVAIPLDISSRQLSSGVAAVGSDILEATPNPYRREEARRMFNQVGKDISGGVQEFVEERPALQKIIQNPNLQSKAIITGGVLDIFGLGLSTKPATTAARAVQRNAITTAKTIIPIASNTVEGAKYITKNTGIVARDSAKSATAQLSNINIPALEFITGNPQIYKRAETGEISLGYLANKVQQGIDKQMDVVGNLGKGYAPIIQRAELQSVPENFVQNVITDFGLNIESGKLVKTKTTKAMTSGDLNALQEFYDMYSGTRTLSNGEYLNMRQNLDNLARYGDGLSSASNDFVAEMRRRLDTEIGTKIEGLKELDAKFAPERFFLTQLEKEYLTRGRNFTTGEIEVTLKDGALLKIANATNKGRDKVLARLENIVPDIGNEIRALQAFENVKLAADRSVGQYVRSGIMTGLVGAVFGGVSGGLTGGLGGLAFVMLTHPTAIKNLLLSVAEGRSFSSRFIKSIFQKIDDGVPLKGAEADFVEEALEIGEKQLNKRFQAVGKGKLAKPDQFAVLASTVESLFPETFKAMGVKDYSKMKLVLPENQAYGAAVSDTGEIVSVFRNPTKGVKGDGVKAVYEAIDLGGNSLKVYNKKMVEYFQKFGFEVLTSNVDGSIMMKLNPKKYGNFRSNFLRLSGESYRRGFSRVAGDTGDGATSKSIRAELTPEEKATGLIGGSDFVDDAAKAITKNTDDVVGAVDQSLLQEAKKYKSAEEFVKAQEQNFDGDKALAGLYPKTGIELRKTGIDEVRKYFSEKKNGDKLLEVANKIRPTKYTDVIKEEYGKSYKYQEFRKDLGDGTSIVVEKGKLVAIDMSIQDGKKYSVHFERNGFKTSPTYGDNLKEAIPKKRYNIYLQQNKERYSGADIGDYLTKDDQIDAVKKALQDDIDNIPVSLSPKIENRDIAEKIARAWEVNNRASHGYRSEKGMFTEALYENKQRLINEAIKGILERKPRNISVGKTNTIIYFEVDGRQVSFHYKRNNDVYGLDKIPDYEKEWIGIRTNENPLEMSDKRYREFLNAPRDSKDVFGVRDSKTKSQLTDIWKKANQVVGAAKLPAPLKKLEDIMLKYKDAETFYNDINYIKFPSNKLTKIQKELKDIIYSPTPEQINAIEELTSDGKGIRGLFNRVHGITESPTPKPTADLITTTDGKQINVADLPF